MKWRRCPFDDRATGGFIESMVAMMIVVLAVTFFTFNIVYASNSNVQNGIEGADRMLESLRSIGILPMAGEAISLKDAKQVNATIELPGDVQGWHLKYCVIGEEASIIEWGMDQLTNTTYVQSIEEPFILIDEEEYRIASIVSVVLW